MKKLMICLLLVVAIGTTFSSCRETKKADDMEDVVDDVEDAIDDAADEVEEAIDDAA